MDGKETTDALGTPLQLYPKLDVAMVASLKANNVHSLEALVAVPDAQLHMLGPNGRGIRDGAAEFLTALKGKTEAQAENAQLRKEMEELRAQMAALLATREGQPEPKKRGRPPKEAPAGEAQA